MTIAEALRRTRTALQEHSDAPDIDAERIILSATQQREPSWIFAHMDDTLSPAMVAEIETMVLKRLTGMPLAYILGEVDFYGRTFTVTPDVLIPRPDTENLIERALAYIPKLSEAHERPITIADIGTGSGCIAITLALELSSLPTTTYNLVAVDLSPDALAVAKKNAEKHGVADRIEFLQGDMLSPLAHRKIDLIVSNPPYVPSAELTSLLPSPYQGEGEDEVSVSASNLPSPLPTGRQAPPSPQLGRGEKLPIETRGLLFEPRMALDGGTDGQDFVDQIKDYSQANNIPAIIETTGGEIIEIGLH